MKKIVKIEENHVLIGTDDANIITVSKSNINYDNPKVGDVVDVYSSDGKTVVMKSDNNNYTDNNMSSSGQSTYVAKEKHINKHVFVWVGAFLFSALGVDRFMRGQVGFGILKIITLGFFGLWNLIDFIVALVKAYGSAFSNDSDIVFINGKYAR